ncbi:MAG: hypothetical protein ACYTG3_01140 [Planctomycetota bacterium]|jgi:hypothetical protein
MGRIWILALLLVGCDADTLLPTKGKEVLPVHDAKVLRARMEIQRLTAEVEEHEARRGEWPEDWRTIGRSGLDPWGGEYLLEFERDRPVVYSAGPDGKADTDDDVY